MSSASFIEHSNVVSFLHWTQQCRLALRPCCRIATKKWGQRKELEKLEADWNVPENRLARTDQTTAESRRHSGGTPKTMAPFYAQMASRFRGREEPSERCFVIATQFGSQCRPAFFIKHTTMSSAFIIEHTTTPLAFFIEHTHTPDFSLNIQPCFFIEHRLSAFPHWIDLHISAVCFFRWTCACLSVWRSYL